MDKVKCPKCGHAFELTDAVAGPLVAQRVEEARKHMQEQIDAERKRIEASAAAKAQSAQAAVVEALKAEARAAADNERAMVEKLTAAQQAQAEALRKSRELDDARRELELTVESKVSAQVTAARIAAQQAAEETVGAKLREKEEQLASMARTVEDLKRKAEQGSMQTQGEAQELALEAALRERFLMDTVEPVGKGLQGGDCLLILSDDAGRILFESKATKAWSGAWLSKLRDDGRAAKADVLVLVTAVLPRDWDETKQGGFGLLDNVWITLPRHAVALTAALRVGLFEAAAARRAGQGAETKALQVYGYMTGPGFKSRVQAIVEAFTTMREDLDAERRAITKQWAKREVQIERVLNGTVGMYGDLQAIAGRALAEVEGLDLVKLEGSK